MHDTIVAIKITKVKIFAYIYQFLGVCYNIKVVITNIAYTKVKIEVLIGLDYLKKITTTKVKDPKIKKLAIQDI